jgi:hypothetical protein
MKDCVVLVERFANFHPDVSYEVVGEGGDYFAVRRAGKVRFIPKNFCRGYETWVVDAAEVAKRKKNRQK